VHTTYSKLKTSAIHILFEFNRYCMVYNLTLLPIFPNTFDQTELKPFFGTVKSIIVKRQFILFYFYFYFIGIILVYNFNLQPYIY